MKGLWQTDGYRAALPGAVFVLVGAAALAVGWADLQRVRAVSALGTPATTLAPAAEFAGADRDQPDPAARVAQLPMANLFGMAADADAGPAGAAQPPPIDEASMPASTASFQVFGIIDADQPAAARAILGSGDADQQEFRVGDTAPDGSRIHAVRPRALVLERDGRLELMKLPEASLGDGAAPTVRPRFQPRPVARLAPPPAVLAHPGDSVMAPGDAVPPLPEAAADAAPPTPLPGAFDPASLPATAPTAVTRPDDEPHID